MADKEQEEIKEREIQVRLRWRDASDLPTVYANQVYITHAGREFYVIFGEVELPMFTGKTPDEIAEELREVEVKPVAKLVFTPDAIVPIVRAMVDNVEKYLQRRRQEGEE